MELIFNELSLLPPLGNDYEVDKVFHRLLLTFRESKDRYGFNHIRFQEDYSRLYVTPTKTFYEWVYSITDFTLRSQILSVAKRPFVENLEDEVLDNYLGNNFVIADDDAPTRNSPLGLPIANIKSIPAISLQSHAFWERRKITIKITEQTKDESRLIEVYNLCHASDIDTPEIEEWGKNYLSINLRDEKSLTMYLNFKVYEIKFTGNFFEQLLDWKNQDTDTFKWILDLMKDVEEHPFTGGIGKTENLKGRGKEASKRINISNRLSYFVENDNVTFIACKGHYLFH
ncbi:MAG: type II toxin-antitoxin system YoeB family toxin [Bacteroidetes bacterium]|nr:type II toxin-antitoxin system YoeB family toxin [Bacteroidota bacterium]